ncbi:MAG: Gfo/Idh/MocA family oxidoreductase [Candidatus Bathyarchaeota archaeon]|nr:Gfo/Idh/MocA family oxidoreductase [Candidatus Bathyarchaeota archaeon]
MVSVADKKMNVGIVGLGKMGLLHASILNVWPNVRLAGFCDKSWLMRRVAKKILKDVLVTDELEQFMNLDLDVIYVTTPISSHYSVVKTIISKRLAKHLFVEKTLTRTLSESEDICALSKNYGGNTMVGYMKRFCVTFKKAKELLDKKVLGALRSFDAYAYSSDFAEVEQGSTLSLKRGGCLLDIGSHISDIALWFFGDLRVKSARIKSSITQGSIDSINFSVDGSDNLSGNFDVSWVESGYRMPEFGIVIKGSNGVLTVDDYELRLELHGANPLTYYRQDLKDSVFFALGESEYFREDEYFIRSILNGDSSEPTFSTAKKVDALLESARCKTDE